MSKRNLLIIPLQDDGRPVTKLLEPRLGQRTPDPLKTPTRLGQRLLPQVPAPKSRMRHTAKEK